MATAKGKAPSFLHDDLKCPLCNGIFHDAIMLPCCGHSACRRCIKESFLQHCRYLDHMSCPVCRKITTFTSAKDVDDSPANVTVNRIVDNYLQDHGCKIKTRPKCTACKLQMDAQCLCKTCDSYLCERCQTSHQNMSRIFEGHEILPVSIVRKDRVPSWKSFEG